MALEFTFGRISSVRGVRGRRFLREEPAKIRPVDASILPLVFFVPILVRPTSFAS